LGEESDQPAEVDIAEYGVGCVLVERGSRVAARFDRFDGDKTMKTALKGGLSSVLGKELPQTP
jgi:hypothetical protein